MAQLVAHLLCKQGVRGSSPLGSTASSPRVTAARTGNGAGMTDQPLDAELRDDPPWVESGGADDAQDARVEVLQAVVDRVVSWQEGADDATVRTELDAALSQAGVDLDDATKQRIVDRVSAETPHFDVREVL